MRRFSFLLVALLVGCSINRPTPEQIANADYGLPPQNYKNIIIEHVKRDLIDPNSSTFTDWRGPAKGYLHDGNKEFVFGYLVCVEVNSKNRMGGYAGKQPQLYVLKNDSIALYEDAYFGSGYSLKYSQVKAQDIRQMCATFPIDPASK